MMVGIRADESYNRFVAIANSQKQRFADDKAVDDCSTWWTHRYIYPLYDWKTADIWTWFAKSKLPCNPCII